MGLPMRTISELLADEQGAMTVDFVVWLPLFVSLLVIVTDASILYLTQTEMWNVARDTVRRMTTGQVATMNDAECWAQTELTQTSHLVYNVETTSTKDFNSVRITVPLNDASTFGYFLTPVLGETINARVTMRTEPERKTGLPQGDVCVVATGGTGGNGNGNGGGGTGGNGGGGTGGGGTGGNGGGGSGGNGGGGTGGNGGSGGNGGNGGNGGTGGNGNGKK